MIKRLTSTFTFSLFCLVAFGQYYSITNQWWLQQPLLNPATSGINNKISAAIGSRLGGTKTQVEGSVSYMRLDAKLNGINSGIGFSYFNNNPEYLLNNDSANFIMRQRIALNYNYQFTFDDASILSIGTTLDIERIAWSLDVYHGSPINPIIPPQNGPGNDINLGFGIFYKAANWNAGVSLVPSINLLDEINLNTPSPSLQFMASIDQHLENNLSLQSGVLFGFPTEQPLASNYYLNVFMKLWFANGNIYAGLAYNSIPTSPESIDLLLGLNLGKRLALHYAYAIAISNYAGVNTNRHILSLSYLF